MSVFLVCVYKSKVMPHHQKFSSYAPVQYAMYSPIFNQLHSVIKGEQHEKHLYNQSSHKGNMKSLISKTCALIIDLKWVCHTIAVYCYSSFPATSSTLGNIPSKG